VVADKCAQYSDDSGLVTRGVLHDALQCVDAAESDVHRRGAKVGDGSVIPLGDLSLLSGLELTIGRIYCSPCEDKRDGRNDAGQRGGKDLYPVTPRRARGVSVPTDPTAWSAPERLGRLPYLASAS
jgi:hypothetical protein